ncbi:hypothetical protein GCM10022209_26100 [Chitinophaga oryziterrae]
MAPLIASGSNNPGFEMTAGALGFVFISSKFFVHPASKITDSNTIDRNIFMLNDFLI